MSTVTIEGDSPAQTPFEPTGAPDQDHGAGGGDCLAATLDIEKISPTVTDLGVLAW